jgi:cation transport ATPase
LAGIRQSALAHLEPADVVCLLLAAPLLGSLTILLLGQRVPIPFGLHPFVILLALSVVMGLVYLRGVRMQDDSTPARMYWLIGVLLPSSIAFGLLIKFRSDSMFTEGSYYEGNAFLLGLALVAGLLERRAAVGTPSDVLAKATLRTAAFTILVFWVLTAVALQPVAAVVLLLGGVLITLAVLFRLPGAIVPIYLSRRRLRDVWRERRRGRKRMGANAPAASARNDVAGKP